MLRPSEEAFNRLNLWLAAFFEEDLDQCKRGTSHSAALSEILKGVYGFVMSTRVGVAFTRIRNQVLTECAGLSACSPRLP